MTQYTFQESDGSVLKGVKRLLIFGYARVCCSECGSKRLHHSLECVKKEKEATFSSRTSPDDKSIQENNAERSIRK